MATTSLLVEIAIIGFSFFIAIIPLIAFIFGLEPQEVAAFYADIPIQFQLAAAYVAGIIWNRVCDQIFSQVDERIIKAKFPSRRFYQAVRISIMLKGEKIRDYIINLRSLIRISRATSVLLLIYAVSTPIYFFNHPPLSNLPITSKIAIVVAELFLLCASVYSWVRLARGYVAALYDAYVASSDDKKPSL